ncbi:MAG TPA: hypothetical protein VIV61_01325 [Candidatus Ozemobacteraceae bacterium]|jgi:sulfite reductase beta subunit-like hemoprotein
MSDTPVFPEIIFDTDPLGLADKMAPLSPTVDIIIESDAEAAVEEEISFGLPTPEGEIMETRGRVKAVAPREGGYALTVEIREVDAAMRGTAHSSLRGTAKPAAGGLQPVWGIGLKQTDNTYAILVNSPAGVLTAAQLSKLGELAARGTGVAKLTHAQRVILLAPMERLEAIRAELDQVGLRVGVLHKGVRNVRACCGARCRFSDRTDAIGTALAIDKVLYGRGETFDVKLAISDCMRNCSESYCCDIGLLGGGGKYRMVVGGRGSQIPFRALHLAGDIEPSDVPAAVAEVLDWYEQNAREGERFWKMMVRLGEAEAARFGLADIAVAMEKLGDGVDEVRRLREQLARLATLHRMKNELRFCRPK